MKFLFKYPIAFFIVTFMLIAGSSYSRSNQKTNSDKKDDISRMLYYASLAPSSHNSQPWKVTAYGTDSLVVYPDFSRMLHVVDSTSRELYISLGAFMENLDLAARYLGYHTQIRMETESGTGGNPQANIVVTLQKAAPYPIDIEELELRRTLRTPFDTSRISEADVQQLTADGAQQVHFIPAKSEQGEYIKAMAIESYVRQAKDKDAQDELMHWLRFSNKDASQKQDGLSTAGMCIDGVQGFVVRNFFKPEASKSKSFISQGIEKAKAQAEGCGGWIVITQPANTPECWVKTGRFLERIYLKCRKLNLGFHPMNQIVEEIDYERDANKTLGFDGVMQFVARVGYVKSYPKPVSERRPVSDFTSFR